MGVFAQAQPSFSSVVVQLWPEYDRQEVLVIYSITLADDTQLPAQITVNIPIAAVVPTAVAFLGE
ncbi:MAG: hypothetical protein N2D54_00755, partial [Chloroflexota bacterium]